MRSPLVVGASPLTKQIDTIKQTVARGANDSQLALFLQVCKSRGLDPFVKQVYFTPQGIIVSIDGLRAIAERTGCYAPGPTRFEYDANGGLVAAHVTVRKLVAGQEPIEVAPAFARELDRIVTAARAELAVSLLGCGSRPQRGRQHRERRTPAAGDGSG